VIAHLLPLRLAARRPRLPRRPPPQPRHPHVDHREWLRYRRTGRLPAWDYTSRRDRRRTRRGR
jgi:hypothetical protein